MMSQAGDTTDEDQYVSAAVDRFLRDINVLLDVDYAIPGQPVLVWLLPRYTRHRDAGFAEAMVLSFSELSDVGAPQLVQQVVCEALHRCAGAFLGLDRSLVVIDAAFALVRETFSDHLWQRLLFRAPTLESPRWLESLSLRLDMWKVDLSLSSDQWKQAVQTVHPRGLEVLVRWGVERGRIAKTQKRAAALICEAAHQRLDDQREHFTQAHVDIGEIRESIDRLLTRSGCVQASPEEFLMQEERDRERLAADLRSRLRADPGDWYQRTERGSDEWPTY